MDSSRRVQFLSGESRAELRRVYLRETSRLLWEAAFRAAGVENGEVRGRRAQILDPGLELAASGNSLRERVVAWGRSSSRDWFEPLPIGSFVGEGALGAWACRETASAGAVAEVLDRACHRDRTDWTLAMKLAQRAVTVSPGVEDLRRWAVFLRADDNPGQAREVLRRGLDESLVDGSDPAECAELLTDLGRLEALHGAPHTARELLKEADRLEPSVMGRGFDGVGLALQLDDAELLEESLERLRRDPRKAEQAQNRAVRRWESERVERLPWRADCRLLGRIAREPEPVGGLVRAWGRPSVFGDSSQPVGVGQ